MSTEELLRAELRAWADEAASGSGRDLSAAALTRLHHQRLRHRAAVLTAALAAVLIVAAVPVGLARLTSDSPVRPATPVVTTPTVAPADVFAGPPRGPLAGDAVLIDALLALPWVNEMATAGRDPQGTGIPDSPVDTRRVVWAGDVPGGVRMAVVAGANNAQPADRDPERQTDLGALGSTAIAVFIGPAGATPEQLRMITVPRGRVEGEPFAVREASTGATLIVAAPGDSIEISERPEYAADATASRSWRPVDVVDGVAALQVTDGSALAYRVLRDGVQVNAIDGPDGTSLTTATDTPIEVRTLRTPTGIPDGRTTSDLGAARMLVDTTGLPPAQLDLVSPWTGPLPARGQNPVTLALTTATVPSGAVLLTAVWNQWFDDGSAGGSDCGQGWHTLALPAGVAVPDRTFALRCTTHDMTGAPGTELTSLVVVAPTSATSVRLFDAAGELLGDRVLTDGVLVTDDADLVDTVASVEAFSADGTSFGPAPLLTEQ